MSAWPFVLNFGEIPKRLAELTGKKQ